ncbi:hypothetical protein R1flu_012005 [Riccia fluitans]|uniref:Uncharacterized protein n=1 Tax=Riccia fluitans TaxID=41844 RepID=A0ABD1ZAI3_9MARC
MRRPPGSPARCPSFHVEPVVSGQSIARYWITFCALVSRDRVDLYVRHTSGRAPHMYSCGPPRLSSLAGKDFAPILHLATARLGPNFHSMDYSIRTEGEERKGDEIPLRLDPGGSEFSLIERKVATCVQRAKPRDGIREREWRALDSCPRVVIICALVVARVRERASVRPFWVSFCLFGGFHADVFGTGKCGRVSSACLSRPKRSITILSCGGAVARPTACLVVLLVPFAHSRGCSFFRPFVLVAVAGPWLFLMLPPQISVPRRSVSASLSVRSSPGFLVIDVVRSQSLVLIFARVSGFIIVFTVRFGFVVSNHSSLQGDDTDPLPHPFSFSDLCLAFMLLGHFGFLDNVPRQIPDATYRVHWLLASSVPPHVWLTWLFLRMSVPERGDAHTGLPRVVLRSFVGLLRAALLRGSCPVPL